MASVLLLTAHQNDSLITWGLRLVHGVPPTFAPPGDFWEVGLSRQTRQLVPRPQAVQHTAGALDNHGEGDGAC